MTTDDQDLYSGYISLHVVLALVSVVMMMRGLRV
jgi:hypothetical protein